ncbi:hypothetical protein MWT09_006295, partial [Pseudomonas aeruginosa]
QPLLGQFSVSGNTTEANSMIGGLLQIAPSNLYQILYFFWIISRNPITNSKRQYEEMHLTDRSNKRPHQPWPRQFRHLSKICRNQWHEELRSETSKQREQWHWNVSERFKTLF